MNTKNSSLKPLSTTMEVSRSRRCHRKFKNHKSTEQKEIYNKLLKYHGSTSSNIRLCILFNKILKVSHTVPIFKKDNKNNYPGITLCTPLKLSFKNRIEQQIPIKKEQGFRKTKAQLMQYSKLKTGIQ